MTFETIVSHTNTNGAKIDIGVGRHNEWLAVFDGMGGLETTVKFTDAEVSRNVIRFKYSAFTDGRGEAVVVEIERDDFGPVEDFLADFEPGMEAP